MPLEYATGSLGLDSLSVGLSIQEDFSRAGTTHFVGQTMDSKRLVLCYYTDERMNALIMADSLRQYISSLQMEKDPKWKEYEKLMSRR